MNRSTRCPLPLTAAEVTSCVHGYAFGMSALLTYRNPEPQALEGKFHEVKLPVQELQWELQSHCTAWFLSVT